MRTATTDNPGTGHVTAPDQGRATRKRWRVPPPLLQDGHGPGPEGLRILEEFRSELGTVLWKTLRSVLLWAEAEPGSRPDLFEPGATERRQAEILAAVEGRELHPIRGALEDLLSVLHRPDRANAELLSLACHRVATWADGHGAPQTALQYLQAAAVCSPANARYALTVGRVAGELGHHARAEAWLHRAVGLARQAHDWPTYVTAFIDHGEMMLRRGVLPAARRSLLKARRRARRSGLSECESRARSNLVVLNALEEASSEEGR